MYKIINDHCVLKLDGEVFIPLPAQENEGFIYERWLAAGNTPEPADISDDTFHIPVAL